MPTRNIKDMTDGEILAELGSIGIETTIEEFKEEALQAGSPSELANGWNAYLRKRTREDFLYEAAFELWKRHLGDVKCPELLAVFIDETVNLYLDRPQEHDRFSLLNIYERIKEFYQSLLSENESPDSDLYTRITLLAYNDFEAFFLSFPYELARHGLTDEAVNIGRWFAELSSQPENFLRDTGCILAGAGRREETLLQIEENLERFPRDVWIVINAGDAMDTLGEKDKAERFYLKAYDMAERKYDKIDVLERLIELYRAMGMAEKAEACEAKYRALTAASE